MKTKKPDNETEFTVPLIKDKVYSLNQWLVLRNRPKKHWSGLKAHVGPIISTYKYPLAKWDEIFSNY